MKTPIKKTLAVMLGAVALAWSVAGPAEAARIVGRWDPLYGAPFTNLGWSGEATFEVDDCFFTLGTGTYGSGACAGGTGAVSVVSAKVELYDDDTNSVMDTLNWVGGPTVNSLTFDGGGIVTGVQTGLFAWRSPTDPFENIDDYDFALKFTGDSVILKNRIQVCKTVYSSYSSEGGSYEYCKYKVGVNEFEPENLRFERLAVPEPQTLALLLAGFAAMGFSTRRRAQR